MSFNDNYDDSQINQNKTNNTTTDTAAADTTCNNELLLHQSKSQEQQKQQHPQQRQQQQERDQPEQSQQEVNPAVAAIEATEELIRKMDNAFAEFDDEDFFEDDDDDFAEKDDIDNSRNSNSNSNSNNEEYNNDNGDACDDLMNDNGISCCDDHNDNVNVEIDQDQKDDYVNNKKNNDLPKDAIDSLALNSDTFETCCNGGDENEMEHVHSITDMDVNATKNGDANVTQCQQQQQFDVRKENASQLDEQNNQIVDEQSVASSSPSSLLSLSSQHYSDIQKETDEENKQPQDQLHLIINTDTNDKHENDNYQMNIQNDYDPDDKVQAKNTTIVNGISSTISHENHNTNGLCKNSHQEQQLISQEYNQAFEEEHDDYDDDDDDENMIQQVDKLEQVVNQEENDMNENNVIPESTNQTTDDTIQHDDGITDDMSSLSQYLFHEQEQCHLQLHPIQEQSFSSSKSFTETISSEIDTPETINTHATTETMSNNDNMNDNQHTVLSSTNRNHNNNENNTSNCSSTSLSPPLKSCAKTLTYMYVEQSKSDQLAQSHAEDVLSLTLQIQNLQEQLQSEKESHVQTKEQLDTSNQNSIQLQKQFKHEMETVKVYHEHEIQKWNSNYESCMHSRSLAEEDAQQALDLAKESDNKRVEMEGLLKNALDEIEQLRSSFDTGSITAASPLGGGSVTSPYYNHTTPYGRDRAVVSMGRNLLRQVAEADDISSAFISRTDDGSTTSRMSNNSYLITLTRKSAEKRHRLRSQLQNSRNTTTSTGNEESSSSIVSVSGKEVLCFSSPNSQNGGLDLGYGSAFISTVKKVAKILKHSGKKLNLGGRWFYNTSSAISLKRQKGSSNSLDEFDLESMARSYCTSVEALISKQKKEVKELQQFCEYLEKKLDS